MPKSTTCAVALKENQNTVKLVGNKKECLSSSCIETKEENREFNVEDFFWFSRKVFIFFDRAKEVSRKVRRWWGTGCVKIIARKIIYDSVVFFLVVIHVCLMRNKRVRRDNSKSARANSLNPTRDPLVGAFNTASERNSELLLMLKCIFFFFVGIRTYDISLELATKNPRIKLMQRRWWSSQKNNYSNKYYNNFIFFPMKSKA